MSVKRSEICLKCLNMFFLLCSSFFIRERNGNQRKQLNYFLVRSIFWPWYSYFLILLTQYHLIMGMFSFDWCPASWALEPSCVPKNRWSSSRTMETCDEKWRFLVQESWKWFTSKANGREVFVRFSLHFRLYFVGVFLRFFSPPEGLESSGRLVGRISSNFHQNPW